MENFEWVEDIEETYKYLIEKANEENLRDLQAYKDQQDKKMKYIIMKKREFVNLANKNFLEKVHNGMKKFDAEFIQAIKNIEEKYQENKENIIKLIIGKLGIEF
jgi:molecular chaperone GrpE (heat shock protein)